MPTFTTADGAELHYLLEGSTPADGGSRALAFLHGWCSNLEHWAPQAARFAGEHRVLRVDRRGLGRSRCAEPAAAPARHADDLAELLDHLGLARVVVVGHAGGGPATLEFATRHPQRTEAVVLVDTRLHSGAEDEFARSLRGTVERLGGAGAEAVIRRLYPGFFGPGADPGLVSAAVESAARTAPAVAAAELAHVVTDTEGLARRVDRPVLWASVTPEDAARVRGLFADVAIGHVVGSGHFVQLEAPEQLNGMIAAFLSGFGREARPG